jgi:hypothetical protein
MSIETLPKTLSGSARVRNLTHYNTEDLLALIDKVERTFEKREWCSSVTDNMVGGLEKVIEFREFTGKPRDITPYGKTEKVRTFVMSRRWRTPLLFRLLPPEKLYISPVQSLAVSVEGESETVPAHMVIQLADALAQMYYQPYQRGHVRGTDWEKVVKNISLRINRNRKARSRKQAILARKRELLHKNYRRAKYRIGQVESALINLQEAFTSMERYAKGMGMDMTAINEMVTSLHVSKETFNTLRDSAEKYAIDAQQMVDEVA